VAFALANPNDDEREVLRDLLEAEAGLLGQRPGQVIVADKGYRSKEFEAFLVDHHATLTSPATAGEAPRPGARFLKPLRQIIESVNDTVQGQLDLERHGGRTWGGVVTRVLQRLLALTAATEHNGQLRKHPVRSLLAHDH
jgi:hypothetical protein